MKKILSIFSIFIFIFCMGCSNNIKNSQNNTNAKVLTDKVNKKVNNSQSDFSEKSTLGEDTSEGNSTSENNVSENNISKNNDGNKKDKKKVSGLLLGLKKTTKSDHEPIQYETLWIFQNDDSITVRRGKGFLSVPYGESFYKIQNTIYDDKEFNVGADDKSDEAPLYNYDYKYHFIDTVAFPFENEPAKIYDDNISWGDGEWPIRTTKDEVLFVGNKYILINEDWFETGGGTFRASGYDNSSYEIKYLEKDYKKNTANLYDFIDFDKTKIENYKKEYNKELTNKDNSWIKNKNEVGIKNPTLIRKDGNWVAALPLDEIFEHHGNGSSHTSVMDFLDLTDKVSDKLLCYDELVIPFETIKKQIPEARDAVSSPNGSMLAVLVNDRVDIYLYPDKNNELKEPDYSIPINAEQTVVSNQWATDDYVKTWDDTLKEYLTTYNIK